MANNIQVRKVSALNDFKEYNQNGILDLNNSYCFIGYPDSNNNIPHNYKISLSYIQELSYQYTSNLLQPIINNIVNDFNKQLETITYNLTYTFNTKHEVVMGYIRNFMGEHPDISAYWNNAEILIKQYWGKNTIDPEDYNITIKT